MFEHWSSTVYWNAISWEAAAALAAVGGAIVVGVLHAAILRRQARIQHMQVKVALYRERREIYLATRKWLAAILQTGRVPGHPTAVTIARDLDIDADFQAAVDSSQFLFRPDVHRALLRLNAAAEHIATYQKSGAALYPDSPEVAGFKEKRDESWDCIKAAMPNVAGIFGEELKLHD